MPLIDTHAHLDDDAFDADRAEVIARARAAGLQAVVVVGCTAPSSAACVRLAAQDSLLFAAVGIQPNYTAEAEPGDWERIVELAAQDRVIALGETGLDRYWDRAPLAVQQDYFDRHLRLSQQLGLPFIVHTRESDAEVLAMLRDARARGPLRGVMHSFTGTAETAAECVELGMYISFAGMATYKNAQNLRDVAAKVPADRVLVETDSPYLSPQPLRGRRNEPANVAHTAAALAAARGQTVEEFGELTTANARALFRLPG
jgi:TatD DNase family protein